jgi:TolB-like protein
VSLNRSQSAALKEACENLISNLPSNSTVAVWGVKSENTLLSAAVTDGIILNLVNSGRLRVVDPVNVSMIRRELGLQLNEEVPDDSFIPLGKMLGADIVITGSISGSGSSQRLYLEAVDVKTAIMLVKSVYDF